MSATKLPRHRVQNHSKFLLYIDILGFREILQDRPETIPALFHIIATANIHKHPDFRTVVFSDTIIGYTPFCLDEDQPHDLVELLCEFCQDLFYRFSPLDVFFRAVITRGEFEHFQLQSSPCFYGAGLIEAHDLEKDVRSIGAFLDVECLELNRRFETSRHDQNLHFIFLTPNIAQLLKLSPDGASPCSLDASEVDLSRLKLEIQFLKRVHWFMTSDLDPGVRSKHLVAWNYYHQQFGPFMDRLVRNAFDPSFICATEDWEPDPEEAWADCPKRMPDEQYGYAMCFELGSWDDRCPREFAKAFLNALSESDVDGRKFEGRCEFYRRLAGRDPMSYDIAIGLKDMKNKSVVNLNCWNRLETRILKLVEPLPVGKTVFSKMASLKSIRGSFSFCGSAKFKDGKPVYVVEHSEDARDGAFCEVLKEAIYRRPRSER